MVLEHLSPADIASHRINLAVTADIHDSKNICASRCCRGHKPRPERVTREHGRIQPCQRGCGGAIPERLGKPRHQERLHCA